MNVKITALVWESSPGGERLLPLLAGDASPTGKRTFPPVDLWTGPRGPSPSPMSSW